LCLKNRLTFLGLVGRHLGFHLTQPKMVVLLLNGHVSFVDVARSLSRARFPCSFSIHCILPGKPRKRRYLTFYASHDGKERTETDPCPRPPGPPLAPTRKDHSTLADIPRQPAAEEEEGPLFPLSFRFQGLPLLSGYKSHEVGTLARSPGGGNALACLLDSPIFAGGASDEQSIAREKVQFVRELTLSLVTFTFPDSSWCVCLCRSLSFARI